MLHKDLICDRGSCTTPVVTSYCIIIYVSFSFDFPLFSLECFDGGLDATIFVRKAGYTMFHCLTLVSVLPPIVFKSFRRRKSPISCSPYFHVLQSSNIAVDFGTHCFTGYLMHASLHKIIACGILFFVCPKHSPAVDLFFPHARFVVRLYKVSNAKLFGNWLCTS